LHEDDPLRAVRAAIEMQHAIEALNVDLERDYGVRIAIRVGVHTGEVVSSDQHADQRLVTGDTVNVAARLEQAAGAGEVLLGGSTYRLVRDAVEVQEVEPLELRARASGSRPTARAGRREHRRPCAAPGLPARRPDEGARALPARLERTHDERTSHLFTLLVRRRREVRVVREFLSTPTARPCCAGAA